MTEFTDLDLYYMNAGEHTTLYEKMGAHIIKERNKIIGTQFRVYAPNAREVFLVGNFNEWQRSHSMEREIDGVFQLYVDGLKTLEDYKYLIITHDGREIYKADPYAFFSQVRPDTASTTYNSRYKFKDDIWMYNRVNYDFKEQPVSIYEVHLGSWKQKFANKNEGGAPVEAFNSYKEITPLLIEHIKENNYTHIELLPITEHPLDASWGYQVTGYYSPTSRYGKPDELKYLVDQCHQAGIGVILDWVPLHFCKDAHGLYQFDGSWLYEYSYEQDRENHQWGTANFDLGKGLTRSFLLSNLKYWLEYFRFDGIRVDALSYLLYWRGETDEDKINHAAIDFIKRVNAMVHTDYKGVLMIAEDSSSFPKVTHSLEDGGIGFDMKWDLGWMNDTLKFVERPAIYRKYHSNEITFGMYYNQNEQFLLPLSHDEVVHGKHSIIEKMNGDYEDKFHLARVYYSFYFAHPGKKLLFMGNEWGHIREWHEYTEMDWGLLQFPIHHSFYQMMKTLSTFYKEHDAFWKYDYQAYEKGFNWVKIDEEASLYAFSRTSDVQEILTIHNFNDQELFDVHLDLPAESEYKLVFSSNAIPMDTFSLYPDENGARITVPRLTSFYLERVK
ncbi:TPA: 1,4-alpha-glucan branching protein GlgB [Streptococcus suis]|uniref:1,4-alpha-glucan branching protein GlgB n=1 Tax=Streptococcus suis TaxID=1307 RepID=UPI000CF4F9F1|nr:1,4-alpha-glucan branching protein GlgB [Streptococcus suis]NRG74707.1 1,4-alpha-glucan branching protein GlgB [Streptococcus suis]HEL1772751.1 1,4-alpha-glucan branching protein GlgB [Streptococcus suis]HEL1991649.1 1,4-alpha-glucan branching protein GlgB [Streptococcus suis]HEL2193029.1 1,4-alpha-glucan branching protein GlgB [Streptococcus suis]HEL2205913.1 1,4-alpha-glucan branching protein GlgB [Streptococcus suis]